MLNFLLKTRQNHCATYTHMGNETCARALMVASGAVAKHACIYPEFAHSMHLQCCEKSSVQSLQALSSASTRYFVVSVQDACSTNTRCL